MSAIYCMKAVIYNGRYYMLLCMLSIFSTARILMGSSNCV